MKSFQRILTTAVLVGSLMTGVAFANCCGDKAGQGQTANAKAGKSCCSTQAGLKSGWFTGAGATGSSNAEKDCCKTAPGQAEKDCCKQMKTASAEKDCCKDKK